MHAQEVAKVLAPQEHASGEKKLNCALSSSKCKKFKIQSARSYKKLRVLPQTADTMYSQEVYRSWLKQQKTVLEPCLWQTRMAKCNSDFAPFSVNPQKHPAEKRKKHLFRTMHTI